MIKKFILTLGMAAVLSVQSSFAYASEIDDIDSMIKQQQQIIAGLNSKKSDIELSDRLKSIEKQLTGLKEQKQYDAESAIEALSAQLNLLKESVERQSEMQQKIMGYFDKLEKENLRVQNNDAYPRKQASGTTAAYLVNPGPNKNVSYTQDAINSQGNSTMVFSYAPNQLYKIYCRAGYLTDLTLKKGEKISFVGGGDTSAWAVNSAEVDNEPHLYIKPVTENAAPTNIIVTTDKHSYQIILNLSDWYNPMVTWTYDNETNIQKILQKQKDEQTVTDRLSASSYDSLDFNYTVEGKSDLKPTMVFSDGEKTIIKFKKIGSKAPALFITEKGKKGISLVNYKIKDNSYIVDKVISTAELRISDKETIRIKHN